MQDNPTAILVLLVVLAAVMRWSWSHLKAAGHPMRQPLRAWIAWFVVYAAGTGVTLQWLAPALQIPHNIVTVTLIVVTWLLLAQACCFGRFAGR